MSVINTNQGAVKLSEVFTDEALALLGAAIGEDALTVIRQLVLAESDAHKKIAALFTSNRNIQWDGSQITFSDGSSAANITIKLLHTEHATTRTIDLVLTGSLSAPTGTTFQTLPLANNELLYLELDRDTVLASGGTLVIENAVNGSSIVPGKTLKKVALSPTTGLPQLQSAFGGQTRTIFIPLAARIDTVGGGQDLWWIFSGQRWQSGTVQVVGSSSASGEGGTGLVNYITNNTFSAGVTGYVAYDEGSAVENPIDGAGAAPGAALTITSSSVDPLRGSASGVITKDSNNQRGKGVAYDFTIDRADEAKPLKIQFDYEVSSGFVPGDLSDLRVWIYDLDNGVLIQPAPYTIQGGSGHKHRFISNFQTAKATLGANARKYRIIFHVAGTTTATWTFKFDALFVGPQIVSYGAPVDDWRPYTPSGTWVSNVSYTGKWRRVGDSMEIDVRVATSGATTASVLLVNIPTGYQIDTNKITFAGTETPLGITNVLDGGIAQYSGTCSYSSPTQIAAYTDLVSGSRVLRDPISNAVPLAFGNTDAVSIRATFPIVGWGSTVEMSNDTDTRVVALSVNMNASQNIAHNTTTTVLFQSTVFDTHGGYTPGTGLYRVPVDGYYKVHTTLQYNSNGTGLRTAGVVAYNTDGVTQISFMQFDQQYGAGSTDGTFVVGGTTLKLRAGQYIGIRTYQNSGGGLTLTGDANNCHAEIERLSGPSAIAATEMVIARYDLGGNYPSINTGVVSVIDYRGKIFDTHNAVTVGTSAVSPMQAINTAGHWIFTAPVSGYYRVTPSFRFNNTNGWAANEYQSMSLWKAPVTGAFSLYSRIAETFAQTATAPPGINFFLTGSDVIYLLVGERISIAMDHNNANPQNTLAQAPHHHIVIEKINR